MVYSVLHFILLIGRCCTCGPVNRSWKLRERITEEEEVLLALMERRRRLLNENEELEARRGAEDRPLLPVSGEAAAPNHGGAHEEQALSEVEDLIDMAADERGQ